MFHVNNDKADVRKETAPSQDVELWKSFRQEIRFPTFTTFNNKAKSPAKTPERKEHPFRRHQAMTCETDVFQTAEEVGGKTTGTSASTSASGRAGVPNSPFWPQTSPASSKHDDSLGAAGLLDVRIALALPR